MTLFQLSRVEFPFSHSLGMQLGKHLSVEIFAFQNNWLALHGTPDLYLFGRNMEKYRFPQWSLFLSHLTLCSFKLHAMLSCLVCQIFVVLHSWGRNMIWLLVVTRSWAGNTVVAVAEDVEFQKIGALEGLSNSSLVAVAVSSRTALASVVTPQKSFNGYCCPALCPVHVEPGPRNPCTQTAFVSRTTATH